MRFLKDPLNVISVSLLAGAVLIQFASPLRAQDIPSSTSSQNSPEDTICLDEIAEPAAALTKDVIDFLNEHYQSEEPNSQLVDSAMEKFDEYRTRMLELVSQFGAAEGGQNIFTEYGEREACLNVVNDQIRSVERLLLNHNIETSGAKKSYALVTKLKEMNEKLRGLNRDFGEMYGAFKAFVDKLQNTVQ